MVCRNHPQLALTFPDQPLTFEATSRAVIRVRAPETPSDRRAASERAARTRTMPSRDSRGRFVSFPTTDAPSWYVFCTDGYRIPGEPPPEAIVPLEPTARQPLPRAVARSRRPRCTRLSSADVLTWLVFAIGYLALVWYGLHLPTPHR